MANNYVDLPLGGSTTTGTVTSVGITAPASILSVSGSPVTSSGTLGLSLIAQNSNKVWAGPTTGADATPTFRALVTADLPAGAGSPLTTKGDVYGFSTVNARIPVGTDAQVFIADSAQALGAKYALIINANISASAAIAFSKLASLTSAHILIGSSGNVATDTAITGDVTISNTGVTAIGANKVANSQLAQMAANTLKGNNTGSPANAVDLTVAQVKALFLCPSTLKTITTPVSNSGSTETTLMTYTVPGGTLAATGDFIEAEFSGSFASNDNSKLLRILFGVTQVFTTVAVQQNGGSWNMQVTLVRTGAATQYVTTKFMVNGGLLQCRAFNTTGVETLSGALAFKVAGTGDASSDITQSWASYVFNPGV